MSFFKIFSRRSSNIAKERLQNVLISDRAGCSTGTLENIQSEMNYVLSKYIEVDAEHTDYKIMLKKVQEGLKPQPVLIACIPFNHKQAAGRHA